MLEHYAVAVIGAIGHYSHTVKISAVDVEIFLVVRGYLFYSDSPSGAYDINA